MGFIRFLFWFCVLIVAAFLSGIGFLFTMTTSARASEWNEHTCVLATQDAGFLHERKSEGMTWAEAEPHILMALEAALQNPTSYVKDKVDVQRSYDIAKFVWAADLDKDALQSAVFSVCMAKWKSIEIWQGV